MRKYLFFLFIILISLNIGVVTTALPAPPAVKGSGVVLMDGVTGDILFEKNMDAKLPPASTTKVLTALIALEKTKLSDVVKIGKTPCNADGTAFGLKEGEELTVEQLLNILLIGSCNDASEAIAEHISGSVPEFAKLMNKRAAELGATNSNFLNPSGLFEKNHYTSAKDLSLVMRELIKHPEFLQIAQRPSFKVENTNVVKEERWVVNKNYLLQKNSWTYYKDCIAGKNGYTIEAKHSFIAAAKRGEQSLIVTILHTDDKNEYFRNIVSLFDYGFNNFKLFNALPKDSKIKDVTIDNESIPLTSANDFYYVKANDSQDALAINYNLQDLEKMPFKKNDVVGNASISLGTRILGNVPIIANADSPNKSILSLSSSTKNGPNKFLLAGGCISTIGILFLIRAILIKNKKKRKKVK